MVTGRGTRGREPVYYDFRGVPLHLGYVHCPGHHDPVKITSSKCEYCGKHIKGEYCTCDGRFSFTK